MDCILHLVDLYLQGELTYNELLKKMCNNYNKSTLERLFKTMYTKFEEFTKINRKEIDRFYSDSKNASYQEFSDLMGQIHRTDELETALNIVLKAINDYDSFW